MKIYVTILMLFASMFAHVIFAEGARKLTKEETVELDQLQQTLKRAIEARNFSLLESKSISEKKLEVWLCEKRDAPSEILSFAELAQKLTTMAKGRTIRVHPIAELTMSFLLVETKGWRENGSYLNFRFLATGVGTQWTGISICRERRSEAAATEKDFSSDVDLNKPADRRMGIQAQTALHVKQAIVAMDFSLLRKYVPEGRAVRVGYCGPGDSPPIDVGIEMLNQRLVKEIGQEPIRFNPFPRSTLNLDSGTAGIETEGWNSTEPYHLFAFSYQRDLKRWVWTDMCSDTRNR